MQLQYSIYSTVLEDTPEDNETEGVGNEDEKSEQMTIETAKSEAVAQETEKEEDKSAEVESKAVNNENPSVQKEIHKSQLQKRLERLLL